MKKPTVGQTLYSLNVGNAARGREQKLTPVVVTKVGLKYFTVTQDPDRRFSIETQYRLDTWRGNSKYLAIAKLYETEQEWKDEKEERELSKTIYSAFEYGRNKTGISLPGLRAIMSIIEEGE